MESLHIVSFHAFSLPLSFPLPNIIFHKFSHVHLLLCVFSWYSLSQNYPHSSPPFHQQPYPYLSVISICPFHCETQSCRTHYCPPLLSQHLVPILFVARVFYSQDVFSSVWRLSSVVFVSLASSKKLYSKWLLIDWQGDILWGCQTWVYQGANLCS